MCYFVDTMRIAERAIELIRDGDIVGLGTGRAATEFVQVLGQKVADGLKIQGVPTSRDTAELATRLGIPLLHLGEAGELDLAVDGADEVDPKLNLIKGYGGAMVREKIVEASARRLVILVGPEKMVDVLGRRGRLPVEVLPFGLPLCRRRLSALGLKPESRGGDAPFVTDNGNQILDCGVGPISDPSELEHRILAIPGVVGTGLFVGMADTVLIQRGNEVEERHRRA